MTTPTRTTPLNFAGKPNSTPEISKAVEMLFRAHLHQDPFQIENAMKHLEFLEYLQRLNHDRDAVLLGYERGERQRR